MTIEKRERELMKLEPMYEFVYRDWLISGVNRENDCVMIMDCGNGVQFTEARLKKHSRTYASC